MDMIPVMVMNRLLGLLAIGTIGIIVTAVAMLVTRRVPVWAAELALPLAATIATVTTLGSLYYSQIAGYPPCTLCWYQRIAIYPQVVLLWVATVRRDVGVWITSGIIATIGVVISAWHVVIERNPALAGPCDPANPCTLKWVEEFGFLTIPTMAGIAGLSFIALTLLARAGTIYPTTDLHTDLHTDRSET
jgi:disulfide bond formation protein DsbB